MPFPCPRDLPDPGIESRSPALKADSFLSEPPGKPTNMHDGYRILLHKGLMKPARMLPQEIDTYLFSFMFFILLIRWQK